MTDKRHRTKADLAPFALRLSTSFNYPAGIFKVENTMAAPQHEFLKSNAAIHQKKSDSGNILYYTDQIFFDTVVGQMYTEQVFFDTVRGQMYTEQVFFDTVVGQMYTEQVFFDTVVGQMHTEQVYNFRIEVKMIEKQQNEYFREDLNYYYQTIQIHYYTSMKKLTIQKGTGIHIYKRNIG